MTHSDQDNSWALVWMDALLIVPALFGIMFLSGFWFSLIMGGLAVLAGGFGLLYWWASGHPQSLGAHLLELLHVGPRHRHA